MNDSISQNIDGSILEHFTSLENVYYAYRSVFRLTSNETEEKRRFRSIATEHALTQVSEKDAMFFSAIASYLVSLDKSNLREIVQEVGIKLHEKQLKRADWKPFVVERILFRALKPFVRVLLETFLSYSSKELIKSVERQYGSVTSFIEHLHDDDTSWVKWMKEKGKDSSENRMFGAAVNKIAIYQAYLMTKADGASNELRNSFSPIDKAIYNLEILQGYYYYRGALEHMDDITSKVSFIDALQQAKDFEEKYVVEKIQSEDLNRKLTNISRNSDEQLSEALTIINTLEEEVGQLKNEIEKQHELILQYQAAMKRMSNQQLAGKHVLVIGHKAQRNMYDQEIAARGGICEFFFADSKGGAISRLLKGALSRADLIIHITSYSNHMISDFLKGSNMKSSEKFVPLDVTGRDSFTRELDKFLANQQVDKAFSLSLR